MDFINWKEVLQENSPKFQEYINEQRTSKGVCRLFGAVVRGAIRDCYVINQTGDSKRNNILSQSDVLAFTRRLVSFIYESKLDIWNLTTFLSNKLINAFYDYLVKNCEALGYMQFQTAVDYRLNLSLLLIEIQRIRDSRSSLQKSTPDSFNATPGLSVQVVSQFVDNSIASQQIMGDAASSFGAFLLGYYYFFDLSWDKALHYWKYCHAPNNAEWDCDGVDLIVSNIISLDNRPIPSEEATYLDLSSLSPLPYYHPPSDPSHTCLTAGSEVFYDRLIPNIQHHLRLWNQCSSYFVNVDSFHNDKTGYMCLMRSLYMANYISEMICLSQYFPFCSYDDVKVMLKTHDFDNACIYFISDVPLLEILIQLYSERRVVNQRNNTYDLLVHQMQNPNLNSFNDSSILKTEKENLERRLFRYLYKKFVISMP